MYDKNVVGNIRSWDTRRSGRKRNWIHSNDYDVDVFHVAMWPVLEGTGNLALSES